MGINRGISGGAGEVFVLSVGDVGSTPVVSVLLGQAKVYEEEFVAVAPDSHQEIICKKRKNIDYVVEWHVWVSSCVPNIGIGVSK